MGRRYKRYLSLILAIILTVSIMSIGASASAYSPKDGLVRQYKNYTVLGDSIAAAYGTYAYYAMLPEGSQICDKNVIPGSYVDLVSQAIGAENTYMHAHSAWRTTEFLRELNYPGFEYDNDQYSAYYKSDYFRNGLNYLPPDALDGEGERMAEDIAKADIITMNYGENDIFTYALTVTVNKFGYLLIDDTGELSIKPFDNLAEAFTEILRIATGEQIVEILLDYINSLEVGFLMFKHNLPLAIDAIKTLNPDVDLYVLGFSDPLNLNFPIDFKESFGIDIYLVSDLMVAGINDYIEYLCPARDEYTFIDVTGTTYYGSAAIDWTQLPKGLNGMKYSTIRMFHPNEKGQEFMAKQIIETLTEPLPFLDVNKENRYYEGVMYCYNNGLMSGETEHFFCPDFAMTRAQMASILYRMAGSPDVSGMRAPFIDVNKLSWAYDAIVWAYNQGIISGVTKLSFKPSSCVSRAQAVTMLYRYAGSPQISGKADYKDFKLIPSEYRDAVTWASQNGIISGFDSGYFNASAIITRGQIADIVYNFSSLAK